MLEKLVQVLESRAAIRLAVILAIVVSLPALGVVPVLDDVIHAVLYQGALEGWKRGPFELYDLVHLPWRDAWIGLGSVLGAPSAQELWLQTEHELLQLFRDGHDVLWSRIVRDANRLESVQHIRRRYAVFTFQATFNCSVTPRLHAHLI